MEYPRLFLRILHLHNEEELSLFIQDMIEFLSLSKEENKLFGLIFSAIKLSRYVLSKRPRELTSQLLGRLDRFVNPSNELKEYLTKVKEFGCGDKQIEWICPIKESGAMCHSS